MISLNHESFNQHRRYFTHVTHLCLHDAASDQLPSLPKDGWQNYDVRAMLHQCFREYTVRFFLETIVCIIKCVQSKIERIWYRQKLLRVCQSYRESSQHLWRHFLHYDIISLKVPFRLTGHIYFLVHSNNYEQIMCIENQGCTLPCHIWIFQKY